MTKTLLTTLLLFAVLSCGGSEGDDGTQTETGVPQPSPSPLGVTTDVGEDELLHCDPAAKAYGRTVYRCEFNGTTCFVYAGFRVGAISCVQEWH